MTTDEPTTDERYATQIMLSGKEMGLLVRHLPVPIPPEQWAKYAEDAAVGSADCEEYDATEKARRKAWNEEQKDRLSEVKRLLSLVHAKEEKSNVDCKSYALLDSNEYVIIRLDTNTVIESRAMSAEERQRAEQQSLPLGDNAPREYDEFDGEDPDNLPPEAE